VIEDFAEFEASALRPELLQGVLERHRDEAHKLLACAAQEWIADGCPRFNDHETSCTAVLIGFLDDTLRAGRSNRFQIAVFPEAGGWTDAHLDGRADPNTVPRPDVALFLGVHHDVKMPVECKRLLRGYASASDYVMKGLQRFLNGTYDVGDEQATMICFALDRDAPQACTDINKVIVERLSSGETLTLAPPLGSLRSVYHSQHRCASRPFQAVHLLLDIKARPDARPRRVSR
jgi:hypothetical protein